MCCRNSAATLTQTDVYMLQRACNGWPPIVTTRRLLRLVEGWNFALQYRGNNESGNNGFGEGRLGNGTNRGTNKETVTVSASLPLMTLTSG